MAIALATSSTNPLSDSNSFLLQKTGGTNDQGKGVSYDFTVDNASKAKVMKISFDYIVNSGTFTAGTPGVSGTDSDIIVYIYDKTNSVMIEPSSFKLFSNSSTIPDSYSGYFQTASNSTSYRLIFHTATTTTNNFELKIDSVKVERAAYQYGTPITDWASYTSTLTNAGNATNAGKWRRIGDSMQVRVRITIGSTVPTGIFLFSPPPGYSIDTNKIIGTDLASVIGSGEIVKAGAGYNLQVLYSSTTSLFFAYQSTLTGAQTGVNATAPVTLAAGDIVTGIVTFPVLGWSSSVQMSDSSNQQAITARLTSGSTSVTSATTTKLNITTATEDSAGGFSASNSRYIIQVPGYYTFQGEFSYTVPTNTGFRSACRIYKNGLQISDSSYVYPINQLGNSSVVSISTPSFQCNAGDYIELYGYQESTSTVTALTQYLSIQKVTGPSAIAASETVAASYWLSANFAASTTVPINFDSKEFDYQGSVTTSATAWKFIAPIAGLYEVNTSVNPSVGANLVLYKNNAAYKAIQGGVSGANIGGSTQIRLLAGDYIDLRPSTAVTVGGGSLASSSTSNIAIAKIGNY
ncbi:MAG: hypothetical protein EBZ95_04895 [Chitinophagia bacterium]|nr:hypothetical protein [Chitinophagia bacterium]